MKTFRIARLCVPAALVLALVGCDDPAKDKGAAAVPSPAPVATTKATAAAAAADEYLAIDAAASSIDFVGSKVTGSHAGKFSTFTGSIGLGAGSKPEGGKVKVEITLASVKSDDAKLDGHLKAPDFFDVAKFPTASFSSSEVKAGGEKGATHTVTGLLELHGEKKTISFPATITVAGDAVSATAEFSINRKDFGIVYPGMADDLIRDAVVIKLAIKAGKKR